MVCPRRIVPITIGASPISNADDRYWNVAAERPTGVIELSKDLAIVLRLLQSRAGRMKVIKRSVNVESTRSSVAEVERCRGTIDGLLPL